MTEAMDGFAIHTVTHLTRPWGRRARDLAQLRDGIAQAPVEVLFRHLVQFPLRDPASETPAPDDISAWVGGVLQDRETAERISFAVQASRSSQAGARSALLGVLDSVPARTRAERGAPEGSEFEFLLAVSLPYPTGEVASDAGELVEALLEGDPGAWFLNLVEEPWYADGRSRALEWLERGGDPRGAAWLREAAGSGLPIEAARARLARRWRRSRLALSLARSSDVPEDARRRAAREAIKRFVRRRTAADERS